MKRAGNLFEAVVDRDNLLLAFSKASRGKADRPDRGAFAANLLDEIEALRAGLLDGTYPVGNYVQFTIRDPKERVITAAPFRERVLQHALMNVCEPLFDKWMIFDTYASRRGKGQLAAVRRAREFAGRHAWFLKCDFRKYFDSIPHEGLRRMFRRKLKDARLAGWFDRILDTYETAPGRGLPIGNLASQHFANLYLDGLDRKWRPYVRYMDDFVVWADDRETLRRIRDEAKRYAADELDLAIKEEPIINRTAHGMDFLGMRVFPGSVRLSRASRRRFLQKTRTLEWIPQSTFQRNGASVA
ncbi:MAG: group II intron reverse transcriptase domain-containing protein [Kiritimatiellae bacterium]|nr:group II intron reverse transcriptase domain-containing protein [Kiritimatiellia bacterium]